MAIRRLRYRLLIGLALAVSVGLATTMVFYVHQAEEAILAEHDRALHKVTEAVGSSLESIMLGSHAEVAAEFNRRLARVGGARMFTILRRDGRKAFIDNRTIDRVNQTLGRMAFEPRAEAPGGLPAILDGEVAAFREALGGQEARSYIRFAPDGEKILGFIDPIFAQPGCRKCHDDGEKVRGMVVLESSYAMVERDLARARLRALSGLALALAGTLGVTGFLLGRLLFRPIEGVTSAMRRVTEGDWECHVPVAANDEIGQMAGNFNRMRGQLRETYVNMLAERDKLTTILLTAREAVVVTDRDGHVVLVNPAAEQVLGKSIRQIEEQGFSQLVDDPGLILSILAGEQESAGVLLNYRGRMLEISASTICDAQARAIGSAALIRDVDEECRLRQRLEWLACTDELTGLYNRRHLDQRYAEEFDRAGVSGQSLAVIMFDVDHFKRFNDQHGHEAGDRVLRAVGLQTRETLRRYDVLGRYGGEEFIAVLPGLRGRDAGVVAERLRADVEALDLEGLHVTVSVGVASTDVLGQGQTGDLLAQADAALYRAKRGGRNRVEVATAGSGMAGSLT